LAPATLLFILDPETSVETVEAELRQLYGLTSMEACLANLLMEGKALDECCKILNIRRTTARTHLQHLFEKVGVQRQSELVSLLLKSIGLVGAANKPAISRTANRKSTASESGEEPSYPACTSDQALASSFKIRSICQVASLR
jgi:DNA-binding CsgD family transcriptional regulator